ncbi:Uncharacterised protein [Mycobacteroides abscessus subsp. massiliense]|nr:Uncharacterised protein [Mycobacteroides abscessus subsp. massiliense]
MQCAQCVLMETFDRAQPCRRHDRRAIAEAVVQRSGRGAGRTGDGGDGCGAGTAVEQ